MELLERHFEIALETPDGIKKLRELILSLAMQGKLVPQDPNDEPASELLKEIEAEKKRLVKEGKMKKQEPLPPIKPEEIPYEAPKGWEWVRLGEIGNTNIGLTYSPKDISENGVPVLRSNNIQKEMIDLNNLVRVNKEINDNLYVQQGDILICARNGSKALVGKSALIKELPEKMVFGAFMAIFRSNYNDYVRIFLNSPIFRKVLDDVSTTTINQITQNNLKNSIIPLPPLAEQKRIVAKIDQLMTLCDKLEEERNERNQKRLTIHTAAMNRLLLAPDKITFNTSWDFITKNFDKLYSVPENVEDLKKAILQLAVMGKLVPQDPNDQPASELLKEIEAGKKRLVKEGKIKKQEPLPPIKPEEIPFEVPKGWEWVRLNQIFDVRDGTHDTPKYVTVGVPLITSRNFKNGEIDFNDVKLISFEDHNKIKQRSFVEKDDILFSMIGGNIGNMVMVNTDKEFSIKNVALFKYYDKKLTYPGYLMLYLKNLSYIIQSKAVGGAQPFVSLSFLRNHLFPIPTIKTQRLIVAKVDQLMELCNSLEQQILESTDRQTLILNAIFAKV